MDALGDADVTVVRPVTVPVLAVTEGPAEFDAQEASNKVRAAKRPESLIIVLPFGDSSLCSLAK